MKQNPLVPAVLALLLWLAQGAREVWLRLEAGVPEGDQLRIVSEPPAQVWLLVASLHGQQKLYRGPTHRLLPVRPRSASDRHYVLEAPGYEPLLIEARSTWVGSRYPAAGAVQLQSRWPLMALVRVPGFPLGAGLLLWAAVLLRRQRRSWQGQLRLQQNFVEGKVGSGLEIGPYRVVRPLGQGGMGAVYEVTMPDHPGERRALKLMHLDLGSEARQRFQREVRLSLPLQHPHLVAFYDFGEWNRRPYLVMELLEGQPLERAWVDQPLGWRLARLSEAALGLKALHELGIVHRDLKPANLMVCRGKTLVMDFGIARELQGSELSQAGQVIGTPGYMAPEQVLGLTPSPASDAYALAMIVYQACADRLAIQADTLSDLLIRQASEDAISLSHHRPDLPAEFTGWIDSLLSRQPEQRPCHNLSEQLLFWSRQLA
jgi:hypothetical protein